MIDAKNMNIELSERDQKKFDKFVYHLLNRSCFENNIISEKLFKEVEDDIEKGLV